MRLISCKLIKKEIEELFVFNQMMLISDGTAARVGSLTADLQRFLPLGKWWMKAIAAGV